jgi:hypothetical protein
MACHDSQLARSESVSISARLGGRTSESLVVAFLWRRVVTVRFAYQSFQKSRKRSLARARHIEPTRVAFLFNPVTAPHFEYYLNPFKAAAASFAVEAIAAVLDVLVPEIIAWTYGPQKAPPTGASGAK